MKKYWILTFFVLWLISVGMVSASDEFCAIDVTSTDDAKAFAQKMSALGWTNRGIGHTLYDASAGVIWDYDTSGTNVNQADIESAGVSSQADFLYVGSHGYPDGRLTYTGGNPTIAIPETFSPWNDDLEWAVFAACSVLKVNFDSGGWPSGPGVKWAKTLRGSNNPAHGLFGYHGGAPGAGTDKNIAKDFVDKLNSGNLFIDAWKSQAGYSTNWAIIINAKNENDHLPGKGTVTSDSKTGRLYYLASNEPLRPITVALSADSSEAFKNTFTSCVDDIYLKGTILPPGQSIRSYIITDTTLSNGDTIPSDVRNNYQTHTVSSSTDVFVKILDRCKTVEGSYDIVVDVNADGKYDSDIDIVVDSIAVQGNGDASVGSTDSSGNAKNCFLTSEIVYAKGTGFCKHCDYNIYVCSHPVSNGAGLSDCTYNSGVNTDSDGYFTPQPKSLGTFDEEGDYDIVVDENGDEKYNSGIDAIDSSVAVKPKANLSASLSAGDPPNTTVNSGDTFTVKMTVNNTGYVTANNVSPSSLSVNTLTGDAKAFPGGVDPPNPVNIPGGSSRDFKWTCKASGEEGGTLKLSASASGTDACSGETVTASATTSNTVTVEVPEFLFGLLIPLMSSVLIYFSMRGWIKKR